LYHRETVLNRSQGSCIVNEPMCACRIVGRLGAMVHSAHCVWELEPSWTSSNVYIYYFGHHVTGRCVGENKTIRPKLAVLGILFSFFSKPRLRSGFVILFLGSTPPLYVNRRCLVVPLASRTDVRPPLATWWFYYFEYFLYQSLKISWRFICFCARKHEGRKYTRLWVCLHFEA